MKRDGANSLSADVYRRIRRDIFNGTLVPGERLKPAVLSLNYSASTTVIREALTLLAGERLVRSASGKGFFVPEIVYEELRDTVMVRIHLESLAVSLSIERGGVDWESDLILAHHRLARIPRRTPSDPDHASEEWSRHHRAFHEQLFAGCGSPILTNLCSQLISATEFYRIWAGPSPATATRDVQAEHLGILEAALDGDADLTISRLTAHYNATAEAILERLPAKSEDVAAGSGSGRRRRAARADLSDVNQSPGRF